MTDLDDAALVEAFQRAQAAFTDRVDAVGPEGWAHEALPGWSVADVVGHLVDEMLWVPPLFAGEPADRVRARLPGSTAERLGADALGRWESAADDALAALARDGVLDRTVELSRGRAPAREYVEELTADLAVHAWDLARATGGRLELDPPVVRAALVVAERLPAEGLPGLFDPPLEVPAGASPQQRLLRLMGRRG